jgi:hypothetical protein
MPVKTGCKKNVTQNLNQRSTISESKLCLEENNKRVKKV